MNNNLNSTVKFYGNPAGLGNRYEELARLSKFAEYENLYVDYFWNNSFKFKYKNIFTAKNIAIKEINNLKTWPTNNFESSRHWREYISSQPISNNENVLLDITNPKIEQNYIGIHIRGTDRIALGDNIPFGFQSYEDLEKCIELTQKYLQMLKNPLPLAIFSEDNDLKKRIEKNLTNYEIISLPKIDNLSDTYQDLYYLSKSKEIIMCSKFSTYALTAASIGNGKIVHFFKNRNEELQLWNLKFKYFNNSKSNDLNFLQDSFELSNSHSLIGNTKVKCFEVNNETIKNTMILISFNSSDYFGFEEHFKLLNNTIKVYMCNSSILFIKFKEFLRILFKDKNRNTKLKNFIIEFYKSFKIFNKNAIFFRKKTINIKLPYFVYINALELKKFYSTYFESDLFEGAIIEFTNIKKNQQLLETVLDMFSNQPYDIKFINQYNQTYLSIHK